MTEFMTRSEAAAMLRCSIRTIDRMVKSGKLVGRRRGEKALLFERSVVEAAAVPIEVKPKPPPPAEVLASKLLEDRLWRDKTRRMLRGEFRKGRKPGESVR